MQKKAKGEYGYLAYHRKIETIKTILLFLVPLALFAAGILTTGTRKNLLTVVAVLGFLPASKSAVLMIMYLKSHGISAADHTIVNSTISKVGGEVTEALVCLEDLVFTTSDVTYDVPALILYGGSAFGYLAPEQIQKLRQKPDAAALISDLEKKLEKHLETSLKKEGLTVNVKIYDGVEPFTKRILELKVLEKAKDSPNKAIAGVLCDISL